MNRKMNGLKWMATAGLISAMVVQAPLVSFAATTGAHTVVDANHDGIPDKWETQYHLSGADIPKRDDDKDGLTNLQEYLAGTNPRMADTNKNGISDANEDNDKDGVNNRQEFVLGTNPLLSDTNKNGISDADEDNDHDGLTNEQEFQIKDNPNSKDSDKDGISDANEDFDKDGQTNLQEFESGTNEEIDKTVMEDTHTGDTATTPSAITFEHTTGAAIELTELDGND